MANPKWLFILLMMSFRMMAQEGVYYQVRGEVVDESNKYQSLSDVSILNKSQKKQYLTNENGEFSLYVQEGDTLRFHKVGYGRKYYYFKSILNAQNYSIQIILSHDTINLKPFVVKSLKRETELRNMFMNSFVRDSLRMTAYLKRLQAQQNKSTFLKIQDFSQSPISFIYDQYSKQSRNRRKIERAREIIKEAQKKDDYAR
jgi:hypothetical protein